MIILIIIITGCSAAGVIYTSDPGKKLAQANELVLMNRPIPAEKLAKESLKIFTLNKDVFGQSEANFFLGIFYKYKSNWKNVPTERFLNKSLEHLTSSASGFLSLEENIQASKVLFEIGQAYRALNKLPAACQKYKKSLSLFNSGKGKHQHFKINNQKLNSPQEIIQTHIDNLCVQPPVNQ